MSRPSSPASWWPDWPWWAALAPWLCPRRPRVLRLLGLHPLPAHAGEGVSGWPHGPPFPGRFGGRTAV